MASLGERTFEAIFCENTPLSIQNKNTPEL